MPPQTTTDIIRKLGESVSALFAQVEHGKEGLSRVEAAQEKTTDAVQELRTQLAVIRERVDELKKVIEESGRRKFSLGQGVLCAVLGAVIALAGQIAVMYLKALLEAKP